MPVWASHEGSHVDVGLRKLIASPTEQCPNQDTCLGLCQCEVKYEDAETSYRFNFFTPKDGYILDGWLLGGDVTTGLYQWKNVFYFTPTVGNVSGKCQIESQGRTPEYQQVAAEELEVNRCNFYRAFCCCTTDSSGKRTKCQRSVNFDLTKSPPAYQCSGAGEQAFDEPKTNEGCKALEYREAVKPGEEPTEPLAVAVGRLQRQARGLQRVPRFTSPAQVLGFATNVLVMFIGALALVMYIFAGFLWMTASGNTERIEHAKRLLVWTTVAVAIMISSYLLVSRVFVFLAK